MFGPFVLTWTITGWPSGRRLPLTAYQKFSFGNTGRVCKTLQTILRDKKVEFYVTWIRCWLRDGRPTILVSEYVEWTWNELELPNIYWYVDIVELTALPVGVRSRSRARLHREQQPLPWLQGVPEEHAAFCGGPASSGQKETFGNTGCLCIALQSMRYTKFNYDKSLTRLSVY